MAEAGNAGTDPGSAQEAARDEERPAPAGSESDAPRAAIISNPSKQGIDVLRTAVAAAEERQGWAPSLWIDTSVEDPGVGMAAEAVEARVQLVIAAGGDGTIRAVADGLRGSGIPMGIVPLGTGNLFARNLRLPIDDPADCVVLAFAGVERKVDVLVAEVERADGSRERHGSLVMAGVGIDATMISNTNPDLKRRVGWLAYVEGGLRALPASAPFRAAYKVEGGSVHHSRVSSILIANLGDLPGNIELVPDAAIDDGLLDVVVLQPRSWFGWIFIWFRVSWQNRVMRRSRLGRQFIDLTGGSRRTEIVYRRGSEARVRVADGVPQEFEIDGDAFGEIVAARFWTDAGALVVRVEG
ncbi:diacylglycerol kinase family protein [Agromyces seonyuensis]|uniref:DAGKc domain-containing protein n=1 Tax=Agromyces seonyuensis TaxID=2662446 RepID=A0A6I4NVG6_9MICO|nr:hypothetical protein [Agromyces seonyuensis]